MNPTSWRKKRCHPFRERQPERNSANHVRQRITTKRKGERTVSIRSLLVTTAAASLCLATNLVAQESPESVLDSKLEQVGPSMWRVRPRDTPYERWFEEAQDRIPTFVGLVIQDARTEPLRPWEDMGVDGLYIKMADYQVTDGWI